MRVAIPIVDGRLNAHFGQSVLFRVFTTTGEPPTIASSADIACPDGLGCGSLGGFLQGRQVDVVLVGGIGAGAMQHLNQVGLEVVSGVGNLSPEQLVADYLAGNLVVAGATCRGHQHDGEQGGGHGHGECHCHGKKQGLLEPAKVGE